MTGLKKSIPAIAALALLGSVAMPAMAADAPGEGKTIKMAQATWDTGWFHSEIYKQLFEELGYTVDGPTTLDNPPFYQAVGYGDVDLWVNGWFPIHDTYRPAFEGSAEIIGAVAAGGALQGYLVDKASAEKFDIKTLDDFKRDEVKEAFDRDGDGKADLVACPPGWGCEVAIEGHLTEYGLKDHINEIKASYSASMADAVAAHDSGEPILFYTWTPNWTVNELKLGEDVVWIQVPEEATEENAAAGIASCVADPCVMGFEANDIVPVANSKFLEENPAVAAVLKTASIPLEDIFAQNSAMNDGADSPEDIKKQASDWIEKNREMVDGWLEEARKAVD
ncbi:glycine betaine/L-proline ABC transporter substrate-binding protein ProX [Nitratireductor aquimarinus]|uniref:glycine betaine/L-proline ABC transporter substrate-binding protein ProX n=1 Tax=Nitratireductor TaxID=245876 RepID=UPI001A8F38E8|nr:MULTISPECIES: glycine betaine/L-proline ABC transporter substrate-binding protein ProX [Nitratireductor]MBN8241604.1 glycine betaine/L-proline ABC transporter substrate-binding protein ProX [Nitratireductor aquimarinus]MBY6129990.1 glycine betaine/L-proline ABC transporter substrate-binding protein ProX [Nitratireductor aquimarinus]MCA1304117.1 glycine betaine/L-proline ABC transporter substrate-binding protein ProX [Nitratireductor aquimarinus]MCV0378311.1 glycine betaine/L-proline ABC tran